jgi:hypothetical protein
MDPIGLALENFNALGQFRDSIAGSPIDSGGQLITGEKFNTVPELIRILSTSRKHDLYRCLSENMLTYAIGRGLEPGDIPSINQIVAVLETQEGRMATLVEAIVQSAPFQKRRTAGERVATLPFQR